MKTTLTQSEHVIKKQGEEIEELKRQIKCLLEKPTQQDWDRLIEQDCRNGERVQELEKQIEGMRNCDNCGQEKECWNDHNGFCQSGYLVDWQPPKDKTKC